jgi:phytoene dehydrogenase-like protein
VEALINIGERSGVEYMFDSPISEIQLSSDGKRATGVSFKDKTKAPLTADLVICNADLTYAYNNLLPSTTYGKSSKAAKHRARASPSTGRSTANSPSSVRTTSSSLKTTRRASTASSKST